MVENLKQQVHLITNQLQEVIGYLEIEQYTKALNAVKRAINGLRGLAQSVSGLCVGTLPKDSVVVIPHGTRTVSSEDVTVDVPTDAVTIVPITDVRKGHGKHNPKSK